MRLLTRLVITAISLFVAVRLIDGIRVTQTDDAWLVYLVVAIIFGVVNALVRPVLKLLSLPLILLTLGLFVFVINAVAFWLTGWIAGWLGVGFQVDGFFSALLGSIVVSIVSTILNMVVRDED